MNYWLPPFPIAPLFTYQSLDSYEEDMRYLLSIYPDFLRPLLDEVRFTVDRYDRPGSFLYDIYPDKETLLFLVTSIYDSMVENYGDQLFFPQNTNMSPMEQSSVNVLENPSIQFTTNPRNLWLLSLIQILLSNEILMRRHKNPHSRWYRYR